MTLPPPSAYGLPARFSEWRVNQLEAATRAIQTPGRFAALVAPTGFGKSACAEVIARYMGRSCYLTVTLGLQDQISSEIADRYDLRGKQNYDCRVLVDNGLNGWQSKVDQADAMCEQCAFKERGCDYYDRHRRARYERHLNTNYAKWLSAPADQLGDFDVLIADEAHGAPDAISKSIRIELRARHVEEFCGQSLPGPRSIAEWRTFGVRWSARLKPRLDALAARVAGGQSSKARELRDLRGLVRALDAMGGVLGDDWIEDRSGGDALVGFEPVWPRAYGETLFRGIERVVLLSATVHRKTLDMMGIDQKDVDFAEYPSSFPVERRPVLWVKTVQQRHGMSDEEAREAVRRVDQIIDVRLDRKGIIDTVSFDRAEFIVRHSRHASLMLINDPRKKDTAEVVERFKRSAPPRVLVTPSVKEGYDFPGDECEYTIIFKVPLLNRHASPIAAARCKEDSDYDNFQAMQGIVQRAGRGMRAATDSCEVLILDDTWGNWFLRSAERFAPKWFMAAVNRQAVGLPRPLPKL